MEWLTVEELRSLLERQNRSDLSRRFGVSRTTLSKIISGERHPSRHLLKKLGLRSITVYEVIPQLENCSERSMREEF
jgi:transcriptional regulator with XRE-family HTH domain